MVVPPVEVVFGVLVVRPVLVLLAVLTAYCDALSVKSDENADHSTGSLGIAQSSLCSQVTSHAFCNVFGHEAHGQQTFLCRLHGLA